MTPLGAIARGLLSGVVGTAAMDTALFVRYRRGGGTSSPEEWEFSKVPSSWDDAPAPAQVGKRLIEGLFQVELPPARAALVNNVTHWAYGILNGALYGLVAESGAQAESRLRTAIRRGGVGVRLRRTARRQTLQAALEVRPEDVGAGLERPSRLRARYRHHVAAADKPRGQ